MAVHKLTSRQTSLRNLTVACRCVDLDRNCVRLRFLQAGRPAQKSAAFQARISCGKAQRPTVSELMPDDKLDKHSASHSESKQTAVRLACVGPVQSAESARGRTIYSEKALRVAAYRALRECCRKMKWTPLPCNDQHGCARQRSIILPGAWHCAMSQVVPQGLARSTAMSVFTFSKCAG